VIFDVFFQWWVIYFWVKNADWWFFQRVGDFFQRLIPWWVIFLQCGWFFSDTYSSVGDFLEWVISTMGNFSETCFTAGDFLYVGGFWLSISEKQKYRVISSLFHQKKITQTELKIPRSAKNVIRQGIQLYDYEMGDFYLGGWFFYLGRWFLFESVIFIWVGDFWCGWVIFWCGWVIFCLRLGDFFVWTGDFCSWVGDFLSSSGWFLLMSGWFLCQYGWFFRDWVILFLGYYAIGWFFFSLGDTFSCLRNGIVKCSLFIGSGVSSWLRVMQDHRSGWVVSGAVSHLVLEALNLVTHVHLWPS